MGVGIVVTSGKPTWSTLAWNSRDVGSIPTVGTIVITPMTQVAVTRILYKLCAVWLVNLLCVCVCKSIVCRYVIASTKRLMIQGEMSVVVCPDL